MFITRDCNNPATYTVICRCMVNFKKTLMKKDLTKFNIVFVKKVIFVAILHDT